MVKKLNINLYILTTFYMWMKLVTILAKIKMVVRVDRRYLSEEAQRQGEHVSPPMLTGRPWASL